MIKDRRGSNLVEWIVGVVIVIGVVGSALYGIFQALGQEFGDMETIIRGSP